MPQTKDPFQKGILGADDMGPYVVYYILYASAGADYCFGVNKNTTDDKKLAAMLYIKWFSESSNFAFDQGGVPVLKSQAYPDTLKAFDGIDLIEDAPAPAELADLATEVQQEAEVCPSSPPGPPRWGCSRW